MFNNNVMKNNLIRKAKWSLVAAMGFFAVACTDSDDPKPDPTPDDKRQYTVALGVGSTGSSKTYTQSFTDLSTGTVSFDGVGFEVPSSRTARIFSSIDGKSLFDLDYGGGKVYKFDVNGGEAFNQVTETNIEYGMGTAYPRWTKISEDYAMMHSVTSERLYDENDNYIRTKATARVMSLNLSNLEMGKIEQFEIPVNDEDAAAGNYTFRIDAPFVVGDKVYYGLGKSHYDPDTDTRSSAKYTSVETMVLDYPSLTNPRLISTKVAGAKGATNGYRTPVANVDEKGDVYQIITVPDNTFDTYILKISNGDYDDNYSFNLSDLLGENTTSNGWFYVGNGIGYVPYANTDKGGTSDPVWAVARIDLYNGTAVKLNLPENLWLQQYQNSVVIDGKFYMAIAPLGEEGHIYIFDPESTSADGFEKGASIQTGADAYYIGIY